MTSKVDDKQVAATFNLAWSRFLAAVREVEVGKITRGVAHTSASFEVDKSTGKELFMVQIEATCYGVGYGPDVKKKEVLYISAHSGEDKVLLDALGKDADRETMAGERDGEDWSHLKGEKDDQDS